LRVALLAGPRPAELLDEIGRRNPFAQGIGGVLPDETVRVGIEFCRKPAFGRNHRKPKSIAGDQMGCGRRHAKRDSDNGAGKGS